MTSFLRKRSRSQSSTVHGEIHDLGRCERKEANESSLLERRYSGVSEMSSRSNDYGLHDSCVLRNFPKHKSSHLRFLAWVAYTRKYTDNSITDEERRTCPLLWCRIIFPDQEAMLQHVWECEHLSKGLYWCFHCQKPERVGKFQCKRCQGVPSTTDRLASVAKKIFSKLGTKHHRDEYSVPGTDSGVNSMSLSKISEASERVDPDILDPFQHDGLQNRDWPDPYEPISELADTYVSEMENTSVMPEMDTSWDFSNELQKPQVGDEKNSELSMGPYSSMTMDSMDHTFSESHPPWSPSSFENQAPAYRSPVRSMPTLAPLNTRDIYQPSRAGKPHNSSAHWSDEPMSATVISPLSATDGLYSSMFGVSSADTEISPTDSETSGNSFFTDSGYSSATLDSSLSGSRMNFDRIWDLHSMRQKSAVQVFRTSSGKSTGSNVGLMGPPSLPRSAISSNAPSRSSSNSSSSTHSPNRCTALIKRKTLSPHWADAESLVESFVEVLNEHLQHSRASLSQLPPNSVIKELVAMSSASIISVGFDVLRGLLEKRNPTSIISIFAFTHVAYALAITVDNDSSKVETKEWFQDSLAWLEGLSSERQRMSYSLIARAIWKPIDEVELDVFDFAACTEMMGPSVECENKLVKACKHFLDIQESFSHNPMASVSQHSESPFNFSQASFYRTAKNRVIDELIQKVSIEAFIEDVVAVEGRLHQGLITSLRQLELELIHAGKLASQSEATYERFLSHVTCLCDSLYSEGESEKGRATYQIESIEVLKVLIPDESSGDEDEGENFDLENWIEQQGLASDISSGAGAIDESLEAIVKEADRILESSYDMTTPGYSSAVSQPSSHHRITSTSTPRFPPQPYPSRIPTPSLSTPPPFPPPPAITLNNFSTPNLCPSYKANSSLSTSSTQYKCHCGYTPRGEPRWFASNLGRHKRIQHPSVEIAYKCEYPGCPKTFTRSDNLKSHVREKHGGTSGTSKRDGDEDLKTHPPNPKRRKLIERHGERTGRKQTRRDETHDRGSSFGGDDEGLDPSILFSARNTDPY